MFKKLVLKSKGNSEKVVLDRRNGTFVTSLGDIKSTIVFRGVEIGARRVRSDRQASLKAMSLIRSVAAINHLMRLPHKKRRGGKLPMR